MLYVGGGMAWGARIREFGLLMSPEGPVELGVESVFGMFSMEALIGRNLGDHFAIKGGATFDFSDDNSVFSPVLIGAVSF